MSASRNAMDPSGFLGTLDSVRRALALNGTAFRGGTLKVKQAGKKQAPVKDQPKSALAATTLKSIEDNDGEKLHEEEVAKAEEIEEVEEQLKMLKGAKYNTAMPAMLDMLESKLNDLKKTVKKKDAQVVRGIVGTIRGCKRITSTK